MTQTLYAHMNKRKKGGGATVNIDSLICLLTSVPALEIKEKLTPSNLFNTAVIFTVLSVPLYFPPSQCPSTLHWLRLYI
jgi:hypothetical protein